MENIFYLPSHEYIRVDGTQGYVGISEYAAKQLGAVTYVDVPEEGEEFAAGEEFGAVESRKAASDLYMPVSCEVLEVNEELADNPRLLNNDPLQAWIVKVEIKDPSELSGLMDSEAYAAFCAGQNH